MDTHNQVLAMKRLPFLALIVLYILAKVAVFNLDQDRIFPDTTSYTLVADEDLNSNAFWARERPFTVPLLYKMLGMSGEVYTIRAEEFLKVTTFQFLFSIICWISFSIIFASVNTSSLAQFWAFLIPLGFSISIDVSQWDRILISESISTSFFALFLALLILVIKVLCDAQKRESKWRIGLWFIFLAVSGLFSFTRDTNAFFLIQLVFYLAIVGVVLSIRHKRPSASIVVILLGLTTIVVLQLISSNIGRRWFGPFTNVFYERIRLSDQAMAFFIDRGLPIDLATQTEIRGQSRGEFKNWLEEAGEKAVRDWMLEEGQSAYISYLLYQPIKTLGKPILAAVQMLNPDSSEYRKPIADTLPWVKYLSALFFPHQLVWLGILVITSLIGTVYVAFKGQSGAFWLVPCLLWVTIYPLMLIIYHGDAIELERHSYQLGLQLRLSAWIGGILFMDYWVTQIRSKSAAV